MKYLVVLAVVAIAFWIWNSNRKEALRERRAAQAPRVPQATVRCAHCGVHLPQADAVQQHKGFALTTVQIGHAGAIGQDQ